MRKKVTKTKIPIRRMIVSGFIIFCVAVLAWDISKNGFSAAWGALPAANMEENSQSVTENATPSEAKTDEAAAQFATLRLEREEARSEELALLDKIIADTNTSPAVLEDAEQRRLQIASDVDNEIMAESILDAKGFGETVVMLGATQATVIVDVDIDAQDAAKIAEIVDKASSCGFENVVIVNRKDF